LKVAGISFTFDPMKLPGGRVLPESVTVGCEPLDPFKTYRLCTKGYLAKGKDGYDCLAESPVIVNEDDGPQLSTIVQNHFQSVSYLTGLRNFKFRHRQSLIPICERKILSRQATIVEDEGDNSYSGRQELHSGRRRWLKARIALAFARHRTIKDAETKEIKGALAPKVQQRIKRLGDGSV